MLTNGDFELGDTGFTSDLPQNCACVANSYCVGTNLQTKCGSWYNLNGHGGSGNFLIIDGNYVSPADVWQNTVTLTTEGEFCFSFWVASVYPSSFDLGFMVDSVVLGAFTVSQSTPTWTQYSGTVFMPPGTHTLAIRQLTGGGERDFGLDDISFGANVQADFLVNLGSNCGMLHQFINFSTGPTPLTYSWNFGDPESGSNNVSALENPDHLYTSCGEFEVCLIVTSGECMDTACQLVFVEEFIPPVIVCPPFIVLACDDDLTPGTTGFATATDNCDPNPDLSYIDMIFGNMPCNGEIIRTWTATDTCGNMSTCDQNIIITDDIPPSITCPANIVVNANPPECTVVVNGISWVTNTDNCGLPTVDYVITGAGAFPSFGIKDASGADFNAGVSTVTYFSTDQCGNKDTCMFTVTVLCNMMPGSCVCSASGNPKPNLVVNGDFELGNNFFNTDLSTGVPCVSGYYSVGSDFPVHCNLWPAGVFDHTTGSGDFMIIDGDPTNDPTVWSQTVNVVPGKTYEFCFWTASVYCENKQDFTLNVIIHGFDGNNIPVFDTMGQELIVEPCPPLGQPFIPTWIQHHFTWTCPPSLVSGFNLEINQVGGTFGDAFADFGLDDICFTEADSCCTNYDTFCQAFENAITLSVDNLSCKATLNIDDLPCDDYIEWVDWGDLDKDFGPFVGGDMPMHVYASSGTYIISYLAIEVDPQTGLICFEKVLSDTIVMECSCECGGFTDMFVRTPQGAMNMAVACGDPPLFIPCPEPGKGFHLTGVFGCTGSTCPPMHQLDWTLVGPGVGNTHSGGFQDNDPYFGIHILPNYISQPGIYTLSLTGYCNGDTCMCEIQFIVDCPDLCPCDIEDILEFSDRVDKGFAVALANKSCNACFSPLAVSDCETVEWFVNSTAGVPIGPSVGAQTFCYKFTSAGTYTIYMVVTRLRPDGTLCEVFVKSQKITVTCGIWDGCVNPVFANPRFSENPTAGGLGAGGSGEAPGWIAAKDNPILLEGIPEGTNDGWAMLLTGCYFSSDILSSADPVCLSKTDSGTLSLRLRTCTDPIPGCDVKVGRRPPGGNLHIQLYYDGSTPPPYPCESENEGCFNLAVLEDLLPLEDDDDWYDVFIPYNLKNWDAQDSCGDGSGGVPVRIGIWVNNMLSSDQGDGIVRDAVAIDNVCLDGTLVGTAQPDPQAALHIWPNPTTGMLQIYLPNASISGDYIRVLNLTGQVMLQQPLNVGTTIQTLDLVRLPSGLYFMEVLHQGHQYPTFKIVKL